MGLHLVILNNPPHIRLPSYFSDIGKLESCQSLDCGYEQITKFQHHDTVIGGSGPCERWCGYVRASCTAGCQSPDHKLDGLIAKREEWGRRREESAYIQPHCLFANGHAFPHGGLDFGGCVKMTNANANAKSRWSKADVWIISSRRRLLFGGEEPLED